MENKSKKQSQKQITNIEAVKSVLGSNYRPKIKEQKKQDIEKIFIKGQKPKKK